LRTEIFPKSAGKSFSKGENNVSGSKSSFLRQILRISLIDRYRHPKPRDSPIRPRSSIVSLMCPIIRRQISLPKLGLMARVPNRQLTGSDNIAAIKTKLSAEFVELIITKSIAARPG
jgi:hypothetical protein